MTTRLTCDTNNTRELLKAILMEVNEGRRCMFRCDAGSGDAVIQRARVMLSRTRKKLKAEGRRRKYFNLHHTTHTHTEDSKRYDMVVVWKSKQQTHTMLESLEDLVGHGELL